MSSKDRKNLTMSSLRSFVEKPPIYFYIDQTISYTYYNKYTAISKHLLLLPYGIVVEPFPIRDLVAYRPLNTT